MDSSQFDPRAVLAQNVKALMASGRGPRTQMQLAKRAGVGQATVGRVLKGESSTELDTIVGIARAYGIEAWQLLVAGMEPKNPPVLQPISSAERAFYDNLKRAAIQLAAESGAPPYEQTKK